MRHIVLIVIISALVSWSVVALTKNDNVTQQSTYDRVTSTGILRCGYFEEAPFTIMDPNTKAKSGIAIELIERIAQDNNWKIEWTTPINFATFVEGVNLKKFDTVCGGIFTLPRGGRMIYSQPYAENSILGYSTPDKAANIGRDMTKVTIAGVDGEGATKLALAKYPNSKFLTLSQTTDLADMLNNVRYGKADIAFVMPAQFEKYSVNNPSALALVEGLEPLGTVQIAFPFAPKDQSLRDVFNVSIQSMKNSGELQKLVNKYDPQGGVRVP